MDIGKDSRSGGAEPGRPPSRLLAAYAKAAERARLEAQAGSDRQRTAPARAASAAAVVPKPIAEPAPIAVKPRPAAARSAAVTTTGRRVSRPRPGGARRVSWILAVSACFAVAAIWQTRAPREAIVNAETQYQPVVTVAQQSPQPVPASDIAIPIPHPTVAPAPVAPPAEPRRAAVEPTVAIAPSSAPRRLSAAARGTTMPAGDQWLSPRLTKLSVRATWRASAINVNDPLLMSELQQATARLWINRAGAGSDAIVLGVGDDGDLDRIGAVRPALKKGGLLWVLCRPGDARLASAIADAARMANLVPGRRVALSPTHDAMSFVSASD